MKKIKDSKKNHKATKQRTNQSKCQTKPKNKRQKKKLKGKIWGTGIPMSDINFFSCKLCNLSVNCKSRKRTTYVNTGDR